MIAGIVTIIIITTLIGALLLWGIPIARKRKRDEQEFIEQHLSDYAILTFYGYNLEIAGWVFNDRNYLFKRENYIEDIHMIESYFGTFTLAIPPGEYDSVASFDFNYGNGSKTGGTGYTKRIYLKVHLEKGRVYRYRLKSYSVINKKIPFTTLFEKKVASTMTNFKMEYTVVFEQLI